MDCFTFKYNVHWEERPLQTEARKTWIEDYRGMSHLVGDLPLARRGHGPKKRIKLNKK